MKLIEKTERYKIVRVKHPTDITRAYDIKHSIDGRFFYRERHNGFLVSCKWVKTSYKRLVSLGILREGERI